MKLIQLKLFFFIPLFGMSQSLKVGDTYYSYNNHPEFDYLKKTDSLSSVILDSMKWNDVKLNFKYQTDSLSCHWANSITTNYWVKSKVKFCFNNNNLAHISSEKFDEFRRDFYKEKNLNILVYLDEVDSLNQYLKVINLGDCKIGVLEKNNFISAIFFDKNNDRFLRFYFYYQNGILIKTTIKELNNTYSWDMINYYDFYFKNDILLYNDFSQSLMDGQFGLNSKYDREYLFKLSKRILIEIQK
jgi:hypothetical protein